MTPNVYSLKKVAGKPYFERAKDLVRLVSIEGIDLTTVGTTDLLFTPVGEDVVIVEAYVHCTAAANVATPATLGIGVAAGEDDIYASQLMAQMTAADDVYRFPPGGSARIPTNGDIVRVGVDVAATGASVSQTARIELFGYQV